jgi:hypothetical protein
VVSALQTPFGYSSFLLDYLRNPICSTGSVALPSESVMTNSMSLRCDGCGQVASAEHLARRLRRLEWTTRYRPVHINALILGAFSPSEDGDFLYSPGGEFHGEAGRLLEAVEILPAGKSADVVHTEFQRAGLFLTHILECPLEIVLGDQAGQAALLVERLPAVASRRRRSLKPKRVFLVTEPLEPVVQNILALDLGCPVVLNNGKPFVFGRSGTSSSLSQFRGSLSGSASA